MIARRLGLVVLAIATPLTWTGCLPAVQQPVENQKGSPLVQKKARPTFKRVKPDDDWARVRLLTLETVQKDLGLTADQIGKIRDSVKFSEGQFREFRARSREVFPPSRSFPTEEFEARKQEFRALSEDFKRKGKELQTKVLGMLTPSQSERLKQIQLQAAVWAALTRPEIIKALDVSEEQRGKIRALCDRTNEKLSAEWPDLRDLSPKERRQKMIEFMKESDKAWAEVTELILDVLTPGQRTRFEKLRGNKIELARPYDTLIPEDAEF